MGCGRAAWILYDGSACGGQGTEEAMVLVSCETEREAREYEGDFGDMACYSYRVADAKDGEVPTLVDERWEWDWRDGAFTQ